MDNRLLGSYMDVDLALVKSDAWLLVSVVEVRCNRSLRAPISTCQFLRVPSALHLLIPSDLKSSESASGAIVLCRLTTSA